MIKEKALKDHLLALAERDKTNYLMISGILDELAALRETVRGLDPTFAEVLENRRKEAAKQTAPVVKETVRLLNEIIQRLKAGEVC
jgi:ABC-type nitrate/sulfonate/bicarbonate transport system ATPase subunit